MNLGFRQPIVIDPYGVIIVGHVRYKASLVLGLQRVPVHVATDLTPEQVTAYRIADNQSSNLSEWNFELLSIELTGLRDANFDLGLLGFDQDELARLLNPTLQDGLCDPDDVPAPPDEAVTQPGDLWILGEHRLLCGDSSRAEDVDCLLDGASIHLINTDPPYNVKVEPCRATTPSPPGYRIVVSDLELRRPIWFGGADRSEASLDAFYAWLGPEKSGRIRLAVMDMWKAWPRQRCDARTEIELLSTSESAGWLGCRPGGRSGGTHPRSVSPTERAASFGGH